MKDIKKIIKIKLIAGKATPTPPLGPILSQNGINVSNFCKEYNQKTQMLEGKISPIKLIIYEDKTFEYFILNPPTSYLILNILGLEKGSNSSKNIISSIDSNQLNKIIDLKLSELNTINRESMKKIVLGTAKNMGISYKAI